MVVTCVLFRVLVCKHILFPQSQRFTVKAACYNDVDFP